jgi:mono/diheme cytochrome c family protein
MSTRQFASALLMLAAVGVAAVVISAANRQKPDGAASGDQDGPALYATYCASCHGSSARGDGPVAQALRVRPADLTQFAAKNGGVFPAARTQRIIDGRDVGAHGNPDMPVWGRVFRSSVGGDATEQIRARIAAIVRYLESIQERAG